MQIEAFLLGEDIRVELGNKFSLMGILGDTLIFNDPNEDHWPRLVNLAIFVRLSSSDSSIRPDEFKLEFNLDGEKVGRAGGAIDVSSGVEITNIPISLPGVPLKRPGKLSFDLTILAGGESLLKSTKVLEISAASS